MQPLLLFPCNGNAVEALDCVDDSLHTLGFVDDDVSRQGISLCGLPVYGREALWRWPDAMVLAVPGGPTSYRDRQALIESLDIDPRRLARIVHPSARISAFASIGRNVLIMAGVVLTANAVVGDHVCVLPNSVIHHDTRVGAWSLIGSNVCIAGGVDIGANCYVASGSSIANGLSIGAGALIGMASTVIRNVAAGCRVAGSPARLLA